MRNSYEGPPSALQKGADTWLPATGEVVTNRDLNMNAKCAPGSGDQPGVVDQHVDPPMPATELGGELTHLAEVGKVRDVAVRADLRGDRARLG